jgi:hypothetical protein
MSDFWSGLFLLGTITVGAVLAVVVLVVLIVKRKYTRLITISIVIVFTLFSIWVADRFIAGALCLPWECISSSIQLEALLLNNTDLPDEWTVNHTFEYAYIPRASVEYRERTFSHNSASVNNNFYEHIYQYRSVRGAAFQYNKLKKELPTSYSYHSTLISPRFDIKASSASEYDFNCVFYDMEFTTCYYLAR